MYRMVVEGGETAENLIRAVYPELREMAGRLLRDERNNHTLQRTALVHEACIRLLGMRPNRALAAQDLIALAVHQMRRVLVDYGRKHLAQKRGGEFTRVPLFEAECSFPRDEDSLLALDEALDRLGRLDARALSVVELKFFGGFTNAEAAVILRLSDAVVEADWKFARTWLYGALSNAGPVGVERLNYGATESSRRA